MSKRMIPINLAALKKATGLPEKTIRKALGCGIIKISQTGGNLKVIEAGTMDTITKMRFESGLLKLVKV